MTSIKQDAPNDMEKEQKIATDRVEGEHINITPRFGFWALLGYQMVVMASWSNYLVTIGVSVDVGGPVGFLYGTLLVGFFQELSALSLAELASIWPHPGGPLFWITKIAPENLGPAASFFMGWMNFFAYVTSISSAGFSSTQTVTAVITNIYGYEWERWQMCLIYWGFAFTFVPHIVTTAVAKVSYNNTLPRYSNSAIFVGT